MYVLMSNCGRGSLYQKTLHLHTLSLNMGRVK